MLYPLIPSFKTYLDIDFLLDMEYSWSSFSLVDKKLVVLIVLIEVSLKLDSNSSIPIYLLESTLKLSNSSNHIKGFLSIVSYVSLSARYKSLLLDYTTYWTKDWYS